MSIEIIFDLERALESGKECYACPGFKSNQWVLSSSLEDVRKQAKRLAAQKRSGVNILQLMLAEDALPEDMYLVPTRIDDSDSRDTSQVEWAQVDTAEAAQMMRDMRRGEPPYFGFRILETVAP